MEIIKSGDMSRLSKPKIFKCPYCDCEFKADNTEYKYSGIQYNQLYYKCNCPTCGSIVYTNN